MEITVQRKRTLPFLWARWRLVFHPLAHAADTRARYGDLLIVEAERDSLAVALSPEGARQVFAADPAGYMAFWKPGFTGVAGSGSLWVLDGERHGSERKLLGHAFHARSLSSYGDIIREITRAHLQAWQPGQQRRALDTTLAISLDVIMRLVFGVTDPDLAREGHVVLRELWRRMRPLIVFLPWLQQPWFPLWRHYARAKDAFSSWVWRCLADRRARGGEAGDVLGSLLAARYEDGRPMRDSDIRDELLTLLLAGHETTATALAWALYELGRHPAVRARLRAELADAGPGADPAQVARLPYLSAVCNETLRLHTLLAEIGRVTAAPLDLAGHTLPAGSSVVVLTMAIHDDPALYPQPREFQPDRFLRRTYTATEFLPFGGGHRRCLGAALSDYEMRLALAEIITAWDFEPTVVEQDVRHDIAMGPKYGVPLRILARRSKATATAEPLREIANA